MIYFSHYSLPALDAPRTKDPPQLPLIGKRVAAFLPRSGRLTRKLTFPRLFYLDAHHEQTLRDRTATMGGYVSSPRLTRASKSEGSDTEWHSTNVSLTRHAPAAVSKEDRADFTFCDGPSSSAAAALDASEWVISHSAP